jgi:hypothetical protein
MALRKPAVVHPHAPFRLPERTLSTRHIAREATVGGQETQPSHTQP